MGLNPLPLLTGVTRVVTWVFGIAALAIVIANLAALGWLPGTSANPTCVDAGASNVCTDHPSTAQRVADIGDQVPETLFALGALYLLSRLLRTAAKEGPYTPTVPGKLAALGWFVLLGGPASVALAAISTYTLRVSLLGGAATGWFDEWLTGFPWWAIATGVAALTFAHILRIGVRMHEDLQGTV